MNQRQVAAHPPSTGSLQRPRPSSSSKAKTTNTSSQSSNRVVLPPLKRAASPPDYGDQKRRPSLGKIPGRFSSEIPKRTSSTGRSSRGFNGTRDDSNSSRTKRRPVSQSPSRKRSEIEYFAIHDANSNKQGVDRRALPSRRPPENLLMWDSISKMEREYESTLKQAKQPIKSRQEQFEREYQQYLQSTNNTKGQKVKQRSLTFSNDRKVKVCMCLLHLFRNIFRPLAI